MLIKQGSPAYSLIKGTNLSFWLKNLSETFLSLIVALAVTTMTPRNEDKTKSEAWKYLFWLKICVSALYLFDMVTKTIKVTILFLKIEG